MKMLAVWKLRAKYLFERARAPEYDETGDVSDCDEEFGKSIVGDDVEEGTVWYGDAAEEHVLSTGDVDPAIYICVYISKPHCKTL